MAAVPYRPPYIGSAMVGNAHLFGYEQQPGEDGDDDQPQAWRGKAAPPPPPIVDERPRGSDDRPTASAIHRATAASSNSASSSYSEAFLHQLQRTQHRAFIQDFREQQRLYVGRYQEMLARLEGDAELDDVGGGPTEGRKDRTGGDAAPSGGSQRKLKKSLPPGPPSRASAAAAALEQRWAAAQEKWEQLQRRHDAAAAELAALGPAPH